VIASEENVYLAFIFYSAAVGVLLLWGTRQRDRFFQFPFLFSASALGFLWPQAVALARYPGFASESAVTRVLVYGGLCHLAILWGYHRTGDKPTTILLRERLSEAQLLASGWLLAVIGFIAWAGFGLGYVVPESTATGHWTGIATILWFFSRMTSLALAIGLYVTLRKPSVVAVLLVCVALVPFGHLVFLVGRRQQAIELMLITLAAYHFARGWRPARWMIIAFLIGLVILTPLVGLMRGDFWMALASGGEIEWTRGFNELLRGEILEMRNAAILSDECATSLKFGWGSGFWDSLIHQFVPGQFVGTELKWSLQFHRLADSIAAASARSGYRFHPGSTLTVYGDTFHEVGYFGVVLCALWGIWWRRLWNTVVRRNCPMLIVLYIALLGPAMVGATHGILRFFQEAAVFTLFAYTAQYFGLQIVGKAGRSQSAQQANPVQIKPLRSP
jgi:hypothetical protein